MLTSRKEIYSGVGRLVLEQVGKPHYWDFCSRIYEPARHP